MIAFMRKENSLVFVSSSPIALITTSAINKATQVLSVLKEMDFRITDLSKERGVLRPFLSLSNERLTSVSGCSKLIVSEADLPLPVLTIKDLRPAASV
jgi:hypothetical protein